MSLMAWSGEEPLKSDQVADSVNTNPVVIRRMLLELAEAGLVVSQTGSLGGSRLAGDPAKTTLLDVYQALECGGVFSLHRQPPSRECPVGVNIETVLGDVLQEVDSAVEAVLSKITINDVVQRLKPCTATTTNKSYQRRRIGRNITTVSGSLCPSCAQGRRVGESRLSELLNLSRERNT